MAAARFFNAVRDTVTDKFIMTYKAGEPKPDRPKRVAAGCRGRSLANEPVAAPKTRKAQLRQ